MAGGGQVDRRLVRPMGQTIPENIPRVMGRDDIEYRLNIRLNNILVRLGRDFSYLDIYL